MNDDQTGRKEPNITESVVLNEGSTELVNEGEQVNYEKRIQENSEEIENLPDEHLIFISHASNGDGAYPDENFFVLSLYDFLVASYPDKVYLDLIKKPKIIHTEINRAAQRSTYGVFICSSRYIKIYHGVRQEQFSREFDTINSLELNIFFDKQKRLGFCMIPVRYGVTPSAFARGPLGGVYAISIEDETSKTHLQKAEYVSLKIIEVIKEAESKKQELNN